MTCVACECSLPRDLQRLDQAAAAGGKVRHWLHEESLARVLLYYYNMSNSHSAFTIAPYAPSLAVSLFTRARRSALSLLPP